MGQRGCGGGAHPTPGLRLGCRNDDEVEDRDTWAGIVYTPTQYLDRRETE